MDYSEYLHMINCILVAWIQNVYKNMNKEKILYLYSDIQLFLQKGLIIINGQTQSFFKKTNDYRLTRFR